MQPAARILFVLLFVLPYFSTSTFAQTETVTLESGKPVERELKGGESHTYNLKLEAGQFLYVVTEQKGIDVIITLFAPNGEIKAKIDSPNGRRGPERLMFITEAAGDYIIEVQSLEKTAPTGRYEIKIVELHNSTSKDVAYIKAVKLFEEGFELEMRASEKSRQERNEILQKALPKFEEALTLFRIAEKPSRESSVLNEMGLIQLSFGKKLLAIDYFEKSLIIKEQLGDREGSGKCLLNLGTTYRQIGDFTKAAEFYVKALDIFSNINSPSNLWSSLQNMGHLYRDQGDFGKSLEYYNKSLVLAEKASNPYIYAVSLSEMGNAYSNMGNYLKAVAYQQKAQTIFRSNNTSGGVGSMSVNLGNTFLRQGSLSLAEEYYNVAINEFKELNSKWLALNTVAIAHALVGLGEINRIKGNYNEALSKLQNALEIYKQRNDKRGVAGALTQIGKVQFEQGESGKALDSLTRSLELFTTLRTKGEIAETLNEIAKVYFLQGSYTQSLGSVDITI